MIRAPRSSGALDDVRTSATRSSISTCPPAVPDVPAEVLRSAAAPGAIRPTYDARRGSWPRCSSRTSRRSSADVGAGREHRGRSDTSPADSERAGLHGAGYEAVIGLEIHAQLLTETEDLLRLQHRVRRAAEHARVPGLSRVSRARCRCSTARRSTTASAPRWRSAAAINERRSSRARTTSIRTCRRAIRSRSTSSRSPASGGVEFTRPAGRGGSASRASTWKRTRASRCTKGSRLGSQDLRRLQPQRRAAHRDRDRARSAVGRRRRRVLQPAARDARLARRQRRQHGGGQPALRRQRLGPSGRRDRRSARRRR